MQCDSSLIRTRDSNFRAVQDRYLLTLLEVLRHNSHIVHLFPVKFSFPDMVVMVVIVTTV